MALHIAMFSDTYLPYISGAVRSIERAATGLRQRGHQVTIFGPGYWGHRQSESDVQRCPAMPLYPPGNIVLPLPRPKFALKRAKELEIDVVHAHSPATMGRTAVKVARGLNVPVVFTHHSVYHEYACYAPKLIQPAVAKYILRWISGFCHSVDRVIAPSVGTQEFIRSTYGLPSTVVSNPIPMGDLPTDVGFAAKQMEEPVLIYVGRLAKEKNLPLLLATLAEVRKERQAHLIFIGDGPARPSLEKAVREFQLEEAVTFAGFLPFEAVTEWFSKAALFVFPSYNETQGMVILEALAYGVPVVAVESQANNEALQPSGAGRIVPNNGIAMAKAVNELLSSEKMLQEMAVKGRSYAKEFTLDSVAQRLEELYSSLTSRG